MARSGDDTWRRLLEWTNGQKGSERLAAHILRAENFEGVDPSHPLGGTDGGKDAVAVRDKRKWVMAVYFPRGQQSFGEISKKFKSDLDGVSKNNANAFVFVTNQELTLSERKGLKECIPADCLLEIYHLERVAQLLDSPALYGVRLEFLGIEMTKEEQIAHFESIAKRQEISFGNIAGLITGGDSFCYLMLYWFDMENRKARQIVFIKEGSYPLRELSVRVVNLEDNKEHYFNLGTMSAPAVYVHGHWELGKSNHVRYNMFYDALNGGYAQLLRMVPAEGYWATATRVMRGSDVIFEKIEEDYVKIMGLPDWS